jgi:O-antigen ligase
MGVALLLAVAALLTGIFSPSYLSSYFYLGALVFGEVLLVALWSYRSRFLPLLLIVFLWAGIDVPLAETWTSRRWIVLAIAAGAGAVLYLRDPRHRFGTFHLLALFSVAAAVVSALVSSYPRVATLKALSLLLLFLYGSTGARLAALAREGRFLRVLLLAGEGLAYVGAVAYFVFRYPLFGNPNSAGAIMGVVVIPMLLWGTMISDTPQLTRRRTVALVLALGVLLFSFARAGIAAAGISALLLCVALRRYRLLMKGAAIALVAAVLVVFVHPVATRRDSSTSPESLFDAYIFKGHQDAGVFGSRRSVWDETVDAIRDRPWFGAGFGTAATSYDLTSRPTAPFRSSSRTTREHGSSYLAIAEWVGLLGVAPFLGLLLTIVIHVARVFRGLRRSGDPFSPAVPMAAVLSAGLVHAAFEDWLFAVGYYLCVFFWTLAFVLIDVAPVALQEAELVPQGLAVSWPVETARAGR